MDNGVVFRSIIDASSGVLSDTRNRYLGVKAVELCTVSIAGNDAVLALSTKSYLTYMHSERTITSPLLTSTEGQIGRASPFFSEQCPDSGMIAIFGDQLVIMFADQSVLGVEMSTTKTLLSYTPRCISIESYLNNMIIIESD